ncbi:hypothetical protein Ddye_012900 [Dipteronia dyeriana]|uniref:DUF1985 domain-containing protein n=1 Tax=Dipteronia dyeriana TaxID=168575 RepID=A0AAD9X577_9ROSI|nr:hypothetical protein Ddye_012900 [Dipteronia dyeriana]
MANCFKQFGQFPINRLFSAQIVHNLLLREIKIDGASENELWFSVGGKKTRFGQREFCLVNGLRFGEISEIINTPYVANENDIHKRYWPEEEAEDLKLSTVYNLFVAVTHWLFNLVDDLEAFNGFAWGHYVFKMMLHRLRHGFRSRNSKKRYGKVSYQLYCFPWAVEAWAMEVVDNLIDGFGMRLQDTLPGMRRWTMHKGPQNFVQMILDLEANICSEKANVNEVLEATDDETGAAYWAPLTIVRDLSLPREEIHIIVRDQEVVDPSTEKMVGSSVLVSGDIRMGYNYAAEEDQSIRVRLRSA